MRTILGTCDGFTPIIDVVADKMGLIPAAVYGVVWLNESSRGEV